MRHHFRCRRGHVRDAEPAETAFALIGEKVRREKALDFSGCNSRPGTGSLHPVAIENGGTGNEAVGAFDGEGR